MTKGNFDSLPEGTIVEFQSPSTASAIGGVVGSFNGSKIIVVKCFLDGPFLFATVAFPMKKLKFTTVETLNTSKETK